MEPKLLLYICIAIMLAVFESPVRANDDDKEEKPKQPESSFGELCYRSIVLVEQMKKELESKDRLIVKLQHDIEKLQLGRTDIRLKDDLIESYRYTIGTQNTTISELSNRIVDLKIENQIALNLQTIRSDLCRLSYVNESQLNDSVKRQVEKIEKLESEANVSEIKLQECLNLTTDTSIKEIERKIVADELLETQTLLSECNAKLDNLQGNATKCRSFGYNTGIHVVQFPGMSPFSVLCNGEIAGPGWIVIHQRFKGDVDFLKTWNEYKNGFGNMDGDFFIGLEKLYRITNSEPYELYVQLEKFNGSFIFASYDDFVIGNEMEMYELKSLGRMTGNAGDWLRNQVNLKFSTLDQDNDDWISGSCVDKYQGGGWCREISGTNLNGKFMRSEVHMVQAMHWGEEYALKSAKMLIRTKN